MPSARSKPAATGSATLAEVFDQLLTVFAEFSQHFTVREDAAPKRAYHLWSLKPVTIDGRDYPELYFASIILQKNFAGFYLFPLYCHPKLKQQLAPELLRTLKGKTCFHIKHTDPALLAAVRAALQLGLSDYESHHWLP
jgi:hypothetical protein